MTKKAGIVFMIMGLVLVICSVALAEYYNDESETASKESQKILSKIFEEENSESDSLTVTEIEDDASVTDTKMSVKMIDGYGYIGYINIPKFKVELPVMSEWDYTRLKIAPCRYYGWAGTDNMVIAAHNYRSHFGRLSQLSIGDEIRFTDINKKLYKYEVADVEILPPSATDKMIQSNWDLTLYTCTYSASDRITIRCKQVNK